jgi:hypothetical protein
MKTMINGIDGRGSSMVEVAFNNLWDRQQGGRGQRDEDKDCNNQIEVENVGGKRAVDNTL